MQCISPGHYSDQSALVDLHTCSKHITWLANVEEKDLE